MKKKVYLFFLTFLFLLLVSCDSNWQQLNKKMREISESFTEKKETNENEDMNKTLVEDKKKDVFTEKIITTKEIIHFKTITKEDNKLKKGTKKVLEKGRQGLREVKFRIKYKNGKEISRDKLSSRLIKKTINKVVALGTKVEKPKPDKWVNITGWGNSGKYFKTMSQANSWAEKYIYSDENTNSQKPMSAFTVVQTAWKNQRTGEIEERGFIVIFRP